MTIEGPTTSPAPPGRDVATLGRNAAANLLRGASTAALTLALPLLLARQLDVDEFSVWVLVVQLAGYLTWLDLGMQQGVARGVAAAAARRDTATEAEVVSSAFVLLGAIAAGSAVLGALFTWVAPIWWQVPDDLVTSTRVGLAALTAGVVVSHLCTPLAAILVGRQRSELSAAVMLVANGLSIASVALAAASGATIGWLAVLLAGVRAAGAVAAAVLGHIVAGRPHLGRSLVRATQVRQLASFTVTAAVFNLGMVLVTGVDIVLVGWIDFDSTGAYGIAAAPVTMLAGLAVAVAAPLLPHAAGAPEGAQGAEDVRRVVLRASRIAAALSVGAGATLALLAPELVRVWVGERYVAESSELLAVLAIANMVRLLPLVYVTVAVGTGDHRPLRVPALLEGLVNLVASIALGMALGPIGVAIGTAFGAVASVVVITTWSAPRIAAVPVTQRQLWARSLGRAAALVAALAAAGAIWWATAGAAPLAIRSVALIAVGGATATWVLQPDDRRWLRGLVARRRLPQS